MKFNLNCFTISALLGAFVVVIRKSNAAPLNPDKLYFLDQNGYEVISGAEEFLTPVSPDTENGIELTEDEISKKSSKADFFLYGKFYVLRKKGSKNQPAAASHIAGKSIIVSENILKHHSSPTQTPVKKEVMDRLLQNQSQSGSNLNNYHNDDAILFPSDEAPTTKKYKRQQKTNQNGIGTKLDSHNNSVINKFHIHSPEQTENPTTKNIQHSIPIRKSKDETLYPDELMLTSTIKTEIITENEEKSKITGKPEDLENMNSNEFVQWVKSNMNIDELSQLLGEKLVKSAEISSTTEFAIGDKSFITIPGRSCPEGQRKNHNGVCTKIYIHKSSSPSSESSRDGIIRSRASRTESRKKLISLLASLKAMEEMTIEALDKDSDVSNSSSTTTSTSSIIYAS